MSSSSSASRSGPSPATPRSRAIWAYLSWSVVLRRMRSMARCFAVAVSHAPGFGGMPVEGQRSNATTNASWARSSASPTSRTMRATVAITRADSMRQIASIWAGVPGECAAGNPGAPRYSATVCSGGSCESFAASSISGGKSDPSAICRTSIVPSPTGAREASSTASSLERAWMIQ